MRVAPFALLAAVCGCYSPRVEPCRITCETAQECPGQLECGADHYCHGLGPITPCVDGDAAVDGPPDAGADPTIASIGAGAHHVCVVDERHRLLCWGDNRGAQVGLDPSVPWETLPTVIGSSTGWTQVDGGMYHSCGIDAGSLYCWGENSYGAAAMPNGGTITTPSQPPASGSGWLRISAGESFTCGVRETAPGERRLFCWGSDYNGALGDGATNTTGEEIREVEATDDAGTVTDWADVTTGEGQACARRDSGDVYCWGNNDFGQLGVGDQTTRWTPVHVVASEDDGTRQFLAISTGERATCGIGVNHQLYCWGRNDQALLGIDGLTEAATPRLVGATNDWSAVAVGTTTACGVHGGGVVSCWGGGERGAIGDGAWLSRRVPTEVLDLTDAVAVSVGADFACATRAAGGVWCWGANPYGERGVSNTSTQHTPERIGAADGEWTAVAAGATHTCGIHGGVAECWGWNDRRALGTASAADSLTPAPVDGLPGTAVEIGAGEHHGCAIVDVTGTRHLYCWGSNAAHQVGNDGSTAGSYSPEEVGAAGAWSHLSVTGASACALRGTERWCWGSDTASLLGDNGTADVHVPTQVDTQAWSAVGLGGHFGCGLHVGGGLACWGADDYGQQGDGPGDGSSAVPHDLAVGTMQVAMTAWNSNHACAIDTLGALSCWGDDAYGQTGQTPGGTTAAPTPVGGTSWSAITGGAWHTCGVRAGDVACWGLNRDYQLGVGTGDSATPQTVTTDGGWTAVSAGRAYTCGLRAGDLYCWGENVHGQLGDGNSAAARPARAMLP